VGLSLLLGCISTSRRLAVRNPVNKLLYEQVESWMTVFCVRADRDWMVREKLARAVGSTPTASTIFSISYRLSHAIYVPFMAKRATLLFARVISSVTTSPYVFIVVRMSAWRMSFCCTASPVPTASRAIFVG
jgi:hypothetical protein